MRTSVHQLSLFQKARELPHRSITVAAIRGESHLLQLLVGALALCVAAYLYFVGLSILNLVANREAASESDALRNSVATLESQYFALSKEVSEGDAARFSLSKPASISYIKADAGGVASNVKANDL